MGLLEAHPSEVRLRYIRLTASDIIPLDGDIMLRIVILPAAVLTGEYNIKSHAAFISLSKRKISLRAKPGISLSPLSIGTA